MSRPIWLSTSTVGSSWNKPDTKGVAPNKSPAPTTNVLPGLSAFCWRTKVDKYAAPPAETRAPAGSAASGTGTAMPGGAILPWKSLIASKVMCTCLLGSCAFALSARAPSASSAIDNKMRKGAPRELNTIFLIPKTQNRKAASYAALRNLSYYLSAPGLQGAQSPYLMDLELVLPSSLQRPLGL